MAFSPHVVKLKDKYHVQENRFQKVQNKRAGDVHHAFEPLHNVPQSRFQEYGTDNPTVIRGHHKPSKNEEC